MASQSRSGRPRSGGSGDNSDPGFTRPALAPGLIVAVALLVGAALIENDWFTLIRYIVSILAIIMCWFAIQAKQYWWVLPLGAAAVLWNPVLPLPLSGVGWQSAQLIAPVVFVAAGILIKVKTPSS